MIRDRLFGNDRGVSPVIGVILMVAITVILAAVIGTFVLGLGQDVTNAAPTSQIAMSDASSDFADDDANQDFATIEHNGGDSVAQSDLRILVKQDGSTVLNLNSSSSWSAAEGDQTLKLLKSSGGSTPQSGDEFAVGNTWYISETGDSGSEESPSLSDGDYTIEIIHIPSQSIVASSEITVS